MFRTAAILLGIAAILAVGVARAQFLPIGLGPRASAPSTFTNFGVPASGFLNETTATSYGIPSTGFIND